MPPLEKTIVAKVLAEAKRLGWWAMKNHGSSYSVGARWDCRIRHYRYSTRVARYAGNA